MTHDHSITVVIFRSEWMKCETNNLKLIEPDLLPTNPIHLYSNRLFSVIRGALIFWPLTGRPLLPLER